ncbi:MAG: hypothetical protein JNK38_26505 [Acidobacteria bacterium]|nr:hypothetical protein [Acidobacteriota bacterium]
MNEPESWRFSTRGLAWRLFLTCWIVFALHFATNTVREIYPALALGDHFSFRVDEYANLHPDLFEKPGYGWHINNNPGASMVAAIPYALLRPVVNRIVFRVQQQRIASGATEPPHYKSPWPMAQEFFKQSWLRGYDIKFGLAAMITQMLCMAPISALGVVVMFYVLRQVFGSDRTAVWLALLYAFGTPVFFRTGFLNQNMLMAHAAFFGLVLMWNPGDAKRWATHQRFFLGGVFGGAALLMDYSGMVMLLGLFVYGLAKRWREASLADAIRHGAWYVAGTLPPVGVLWFYQWRSFGNAFLPAQHWMPNVAYIEQGYQGFSLPQPDLLLALLVDYRYGLFTSCPLFLLALMAWWAHRQEKRLEAFHLIALALLSLALWIFFSCVGYSRLQFNSGVRYFAPAFPLLFILAATVLMKLPRAIAYLIVVATVTESWCLAMHRDVERGFGVLDPVLHVFIGGFKLPVLTTLQNLGSQYGGFSAQGVSPLPLFALTAAILYGIWSVRWSQQEQSAR